MSYYQFNRQEIFQMAKDRFSKENATNYYLKNKEPIKEKSKNQYKNLSEDEKNKIKEYQRRRYQQLMQYKNEALQSRQTLFYQKKDMKDMWKGIKKSEKTLKFDNIKVNKKEFHKSKQPIDLNLVGTNKIVISEKFKHSDDSFKYFIGCKVDIVKLLSIILPQMSGYIKYFKNWGKMSFITKYDSVLDKYNEHHIFIAYVMKYILILLWKWKKNYPQVYLEECKYKIKKIKMSEFIDTELESDASSDSE